MASDENKIAPNLIRTIVDGNTDVFRYGLFKNQESQYEDPTYLGFTIEIDSNEGGESALFTWAKPFLETYSTTRKEFNARLPIYNEFVNKIKQVFNSQESADDTEKDIFIKSHYINSIKGLDSLTNKFTEWKKDVIEVELHEDIAMYSNYLASLYNNLVYSYNTGRVILPDNMRKFNMYIKISEIRNLTSIAKINSNDATDNEIANALKNNVTCIIYKLTDCEFDFTESKPFSDEIIQAGIGASTVSHSVVPLKIYYKSVSRQTFNPLIPKAISINDADLELGQIIVGYTGDKKNNGQSNNPNTTTLNEDGSEYQEGNAITQPSKKASEINFLNNNKKASSFSTYNKENVTPDKGDLSGIFSEIKDMQDYNSELAPDPRFIQTTNTNTFDTVLEDDLNLSGRGNGLSDFLRNPDTALNNLGNNVKNKGVNQLNKIKQEGINKIKKLRAELVNNFVYKLEKEVGLKKIIPNNVNTDSNYFKNLAENILNQAGFDATGTLQDILNG